MDWNKDIVKTAKVNEQFIVINTWSSDIVGWEHSYESAQRKADDKNKERNEIAMYVVYERRGK